ncbi:LLM class flavin-dependent oxidoreductase [Pedobacter rhizosphaerae]|uniref:Luciferase-like monooxygenase n=1 Tax=Pedobacter rhizosphaerae TaxID=390241 RepID=A0A1H9RMV0_9SPHI|nr:LLM class flavin-dependent oxidoreductase [Pedobacter rhizosphaerae]SER73805.1 luciferase family oxidoreductase, group 1 [Pedobacter rhizosphaerae]
MMSKKIKLSVLDQSPVRKGVNARRAIEETTLLAQEAERLGYHRFWVSEHHNTTSLAGSTPEVLIAHLANHTQTLRIGSGGIMLPNHSALKVAESFRLLEVLHPGRIDLGMGRAPGTDRITASMLNPSNNWSEQDFAEQLLQLQHYLHDTSDGGIQAKIKAIPIAETVPTQWLLSSSGQSALFAAHFGMGFSFAHFINPHGGPQAVQYYRDHFKPSVDLVAPEENVALFVFCSEDEEKVMQQEALMSYRFLQLEKGGGLTSTGYDDIKDISYNFAEQERIKANKPRMIYGTPEVIKDRLTQLADDYDVNELMAVTITEHFEDRIKSYQLLADLFLSEGA